MDEFLAWCVDFFADFLVFLDSLYIVEGVSVLGLLVALFVLAAIINAFLLRIH